jgi:nicotinamide-nucleotide amidase
LDESTAARIAVLTVGDELLSGEITDTNFPAIATAVTGLGLVVSNHVTVGDDTERIAGAIRYLSRDADAVIITGGLGPTSDDVTRESVARATGRELVFREDLAEVIRSYFESFDRRMNEENLRQAYIPKGARYIPPAGGTAPGFVIEEEPMIFALPGVPREMKDMLKSHTLPLLEGTFRGGGVTVTRRMMTFGLGESEVAALVGDLIGKGKVKYAFLALGGPIVVKLTAGADTKELASRLLDEEQEKVEKKLGNLVYSTDDRTMEEVVGELLRERSMTIAVAESITGGLVCGRITNVPGSSDYFLGGVITYGIGSKKGILGIPDEALSDGAVSRSVAEAMAKKVRALFQSDLGIAVTGVAGPGSGGESKKVGTVCLGLVHPGGVESFEVRLPGDRPLIRSIATIGALNAVRLHLEGKRGLL